MQTSTSIGEPPEPTPPGFSLRRAVARLFMLEAFDAFEAFLERPQGWDEQNRALGLIYAASLFLDRSRDETERDHCPENQPDREPK